MLSMARANMAGAALRRARFDRVDLTGADLSGADLTVTEFHGSRLVDVTLAGARCAGTILRRCAIDGLQRDGADAYRAELVRCTPSPVPGAGWWVAPTPGRRPPDGARLRFLTGHTGPVSAVAWSPEGGWLATAADDRTARIWDPTTGTTQHTLTGHTGPVNKVAWSPDGTRLATAADDDTARVWDAATGSPVGPQIVHLPGGEIAVFDGATGTLTGATDGAWRWLGWTVVEDGRAVRLPAETFGLLPPLHIPEPATPGRNS